MTNALTGPQIAYTAGLLDGRALIRDRILTGTGTRLPIIQIHVPDMALLEWLAKITGVEAVEVNRSYSRHPCAHHCKQAHQHITSTSGRWTLTGARATVVLAAIEPYCHLQAPTIAEVLKAGLEARFKPATVDKMVALGWPRPKEWI